MGLDAAEMIMDVEDAFDIQIDESTAPKIRTVGGFYGLVQAKLGVKQQEMCLSSVACFRLRRASMKLLGIERQQFRLHSRLEDLVPKRNRRGLWRNLSKETGFRLPKLQKPRFVFWTVLAGWFIAALVLRHFLRSQLLFSEFFVAFLVIFTPVYIIAATWLTARLAVCFPADCLTIRQCVNQVVTYNYGKLAKEFQCADPDRTWGILKQIIAQNLDVPPVKVTPEARFVEDLGCD
ncbi:MAG: hypothetical protein ABSE73_14475 [Planctomycetota bacterium]